jgi:hypothetical protein
VSLIISGYGEKNEKESEPVEGNFKIIVAILSATFTPFFEAGDNILTKKLTNLPPLTV